MKTLTLVKRFITASFTLLAVLLTTEAAHATHFRYGTISWEVPNPAQPHIVKFRIESAWRRSFPWPGNVNPIVGQTVNTGLPLEVRNGTTNALVAQVPFTMVVNSINAAEDWLVGVTEYTHNFGTATGSFRFGFNQCCRISTLRDGNPDRNFSLYTTVIIDPASPILQSPRTTLVPVVYVPVNQPLTVTLPAVAGSDGDNTFSFTPAAQSGLLTVSPSGSPPMTMTTAGVMSWTPNVVGFYAVQVTVESPSGVKIPLDILFSVQANLPGTPPILEIEGSTAPQAFSVQAGSLLTFGLTGMDDDIDPATGIANGVVTLSSGALPSGATMLPALPASGRSPFSSAFSWTPTAAQGGSHVVAFTVTDDTGRQTLNSATITVLTNEPPAVSCGAPQTVEATSGTGATATAEATVQDPNADPITLSWTVDGAPAQTETVPGGNSPVQRTLSALFALGSHPVVVTATDPDGESATCSTSITVVDTTPATLTPMPDLTFEAESASGAVASWITPPASDDVDGSIAVGCLPPSGSVFPLGTSTVTCTATDAAGNVAQTSFDVDVVDTTPPAVTAPTEIVAEAVSPAGTAVTFSATAEDLVSGAVPVTCTPPSGSTFAVGVSVVTCEATDEAGNVGVAAFLVSVVDTTPPVITVPADIVAEATSMSGVTVSYTATAQDIVDGAVAVTCTPPSGALFALGTTQVSCSATDAAGNTATAGFSVTVSDTTPPVVGGATPSTGSLWPPDHRLVTVSVSVDVTDIDPGTTCQIVSVASNEPLDGPGDGNTAFDYQIVGPLKVQLRAERAGSGSGRIYTLGVECKDTAGNASSSTTTVSVAKSQGN